MLNQPNNISLNSFRQTVSLIFMINGILLSTWFVYIPHVKETLAISESMLGIALFGMAIGALIFMPICGKLCQHYGSGKVTLYSSLAFALALPLPFLMTSFWPLFFTLVVFGAANGSMDVSMNAQAVHVEKKSSKNIMSFFHGFFSLGGLIGALLGGISLLIGIPLIGHIVFIYTVMLFLIILNAKKHLPYNEETKSQQDSQSKNIITAKELVLPQGRLIGIGLLCFIALMAEGSIADWSAVYLKEYLFASGALAAAGFGVFSLSMAMARFAGDRFVNRWGSLVVTKVSSLLAISGISLSVIFNSPYIAIVGFALVGLGLSNLIPILFSAAGSVNDHGEGSSIATVTTIGYLGLLAGPPMIGFVAQWFTLKIAFGLVAFLICFLFFFAQLTVKNNIMSSLLKLDPK